jgi:hypothetical protein
MKMRKVGWRLSTLRHDMLWIPHRHRHPVCTSLLRYPNETNFGILINIDGLLNTVSYDVFLALLRQYLGPVVLSSSTLACRFFNSFLVEVLVTLLSSTTHVVVPKLHHSLDDIALCDIQYAYFIRPSAVDITVGIVYRSSVGRIRRCCLNPSICRQQRPHSSSSSYASAFSSNSCIGRSIATVCKLIHSFYRTKQQYWQFSGWSSEGVVCQSWVSGWQTCILAGGDIRSAWGACSVPILCSRM